MTLTLWDVAMIVCVALSCGSWYAIGRKKGWRAGYRDGLKAQALVAAGARAARLAFERRRREDADNDSL